MSAVIRAEAGSDTPLNVLEAREWIAAWKFKQQKITSLADAISKAAVFLEENKEARQARIAALNRTVPVQFSIRQKVQYGQSVRLVGGSPEFGNWDPNAAPATTWSDGDVWTVTVPLKPGKYEYKVVGLWDGGNASWEDGSNRVVEVPVNGTVGKQHVDGRLSHSEGSS